MDLGRIWEQFWSKFKRIVDYQVNMKSFHEFIESRKSKAQELIKKLTHNKSWKVPVQEYLFSNDLSTKEKQQLFSLRSKSYNLKSNMKNQFDEDMSCRICLDEDSVEDEKHTFEECRELRESDDEDVDVDAAFGNTKEQIWAIKVISKKMRKRDLILKMRKD